MKLSNKSNREQSSNKFLGGQTYTHQSSLHAWFERCVEQFIVKTEVEISS